MRREQVVGMILGGLQDENRMLKLDVNYKTSLPHRPNQRALQRAVRGNHWHGLGTARAKLGKAQNAKPQVVQVIGHLANTPPIQLHSAKKLTRQAKEEAELWLSKPRNLQPSNIATL